ncbi:MAG TPA: FtsX-like permease family protein [Allosphingosinicella sp.]|jgi:putative ABC transport system permease protein
MWRNYLTVGFRSLVKNRTYAFINIFGLATGIAACLLILLYVRHELSYDAWLPGSERIYQLQTTLVMPSGEQRPLQATPYPAGAALQKDFPQVEKLVHLQYGFPVILHGGEAREAEGLFFVDGPVFDLLPVPLVRGDPATALARPGSIVLTEKAARSYFGNEDPVGRTLTVKSTGPGGEAPKDYRVTGVARDLPTNSHLDFQMLARFDAASPPPDLAPDLSAWTSIGGFTYVRLRPGADPAAIVAGLPEWKKRNIPREEGSTEPPGGRHGWGLVNIRDIHLGKAEGPKDNVERGLIATFAVIAALILGMACINFTNLATARASQRAREVALRKVLGASRGQLILQFMGESLLLVFAATLLALAGVELALPQLSNLLGAQLALDYTGPNSILPAVVGLVAVVAVAGGLYPAFFLSRFQPARVLKANASTSEAPGSGGLRTALVVAQFGVSIGLIACTAIVYSQTVYARSIDPGYTRHGLLQVSGVRDLEGGGEAFEREIGRVKGVTSVGRTSIGVATGIVRLTAMTPPGADKPMEFGAYPVDTGFFQTMRIRLLAGRLFDPGKPADEAPADPLPGAPEPPKSAAERPVNVVLNESAARALGYRTPQAAVGRQFREGVAGSTDAPIRVIIGVVQDSRFRSVRDEVEPIIFRYQRGGLPYAVVRYEAADPARVRHDVEAIWKRFAPDVPFKADFSEEVVGRLYEAEDARGQLFGGFAILAVVIACLGLFGLASFTAERRTKEIGIRKVLGARVRDIVRLLAWQFSKPVILANLLAWPVAWWVMRDWLNGFDARIPLTPGPFLLAGLIALGIAIGTIAAHAFKVARTNPIHALRYE